MKKKKKHEQNWPKSKRIYEEPLRAMSYEQPITMVHVPHEHNHLLPSYSHLNFICGKNRFIPFYFQEKHKPMLLYLYYYIHSIVYYIFQSDFIPYRKRPVQDGRIPGPRLNFIPCGWATLSNIKIEIVLCFL